MTYPLLTKKRADFELFKQGVDLVNMKRHLTVEGLLEIINIKASLNLGLSDELKKVFPDVKPVERSFIEFKGIQNPY
jgi:hypothetical protein